MASHILLYTCIKVNFTSETEKNFECYSVVNDMFSVVNYMFSATNGMLNVANGMFSVVNDACIILDQKRCMF